MALTPTITAVKAGSAAVAGESVDVLVNKAGSLALVQYPAQEIRASFAGTQSSVQHDIQIQVNKASAQVVCKGRTEFPYLLAWTFTLDGHDFYVLQLQTETLVYDFHSGMWFTWGTGSSNLWRGQIGIDWNANLGIILATLGGKRVSSVLTGDYQNGALYFLDPELPEDDSSDGEEQVPFSRTVYGEIVHRGRDYVPVAAVEVTASIGEVTNAGSTAVNLYYSDDRGHTFIDAGTIDVTVGNYDTRLDWRSLGHLKAPGRLFKLVDEGALVRIDGMDLHADGS
jgi:hypothetical protein